MTCDKGHEMHVRDTFKMAHEPDDPPSVTENLRLFEAAGIELGADVTLWYCAECDYAQAEFEYPEAVLGS